MNKLFYGDNLDVLRRFVRDETVDLLSLKAIRFGSVGCKPDANTNKQIVPERDK